MTELNILISKQIEDNDFFYIYIIFEYEYMKNKIKTYRLFLRSGEDFYKYFPVYWKEIIYEKIFPEYKASLIKKKYLKEYSEHTFKYRIKDKDNLYIKSLDNILSLIKEKEQEIRTTNEINR